MNQCRGDGTVAPIDNAVPTDPTVFNWAGNPEVTPCSALACSRCECSVRWADRAVFHGGRDEIGSLYGLTDPFESPAVDGPSGSNRLYFCRCAWFNCTTSMGLFLRFELPQLGLPESWLCGGHPPIGLPTAIGGEVIPADVHWGHLLAATFRRPIDPKDTHRWPMWVERVYGRLAGTPHQSAIETVIAEFLTSDDDLLCSRAIRFLWSGQSPHGTDLLLGVVEDLGDTLVGRPDPLDEGDLYRTAIRAIATNTDRGRWPYAEPLVGRIRDEAGRPGGLSGLLWFLSQHDRPWLREHQEALLASSPDAAAEWKRLVRG
ncbi:MAG: hypothetical protein GXP62_01305 [Oligoflexia bacterium]|nr:hypothetical protein [Oligoflexia bacterium]